MNTNAAERLSELETVLLWEGEIDNMRIRELFGVRSVWASRLLGELTKHMGERATRATAYAPLRLTPEVIGRSKRQSPDEYLRIVSRSSGDARKDALFEDARRDLSVVAPELFSTVVQAMRKGVGLRTVYRSMHHPAGTERVIFPHALIRAPRRWHIRAWCSERKDFRDFTLGRVASAEIVEEGAPQSRADDKEWNEIVSFNVIAHPALTQEQQDMIAAEYFPGARARQMKVRRCLLGYIIQDLRAATDPKKHVPPEYQLLVPDINKLRPMFGTE
jgi:hypothetical protein